MISAQLKQSTVKKNQVHATDTGSSDVQIALLTERINGLSEHLQGHAKDNHSRRGLTLLVSRRNRLLKYLAQSDRERYTALIAKLGLRK